MSVAHEPEMAAAELAEQVADLVYSIRLAPEFSFEYVSPSSTRISGYTPQEHYDDPGLLLKVVDPSDHSKMAAMVHAKPNTVVEATVRSRTKDGRWIWTQHLCRTGRREDGTVMLFGVARDVTASKRAEMELAEREAQYKLLAENASDMVLLVDSDGIVCWGSPSITRVLGWPESRLCGHPLIEQVLPAHRNLVRNHLDECASGAKTSTNPMNVQFAKAAAGCRWVNMQMHGAQESDGRIRIIVSMRDVEDEIQARSELANVQKQFRLLSEAATDVTFEMDTDRRIVWVTPSVTKQLGWSPQELLGTVMTDLVHPEDQQASIAARNDLYQGHAITTPTGGFLMRARSKSGEYRWMSLIAVPLLDATGGLHGVSATMRDVDELVHARADAQQERDRLKATIDSMIDPHVLLDPVRDPSGRITDFRFSRMNQAAVDFFVYAARPPVGARVTHVIPTSAGAKLVAILVSSLETGVPAILNDYAMPADATGQRAHIDLRAVKINDSLSVTWMDATERHMNMAALENAKENYRLLVEKSSDAVVSLPAGIVLWVSPSINEAMHWARRAWVNHRLDEFTHPEDLDSAVSLRGALLSGTIRTVRARMKFSIDQYRWCEFNVRPYVDPQGRHQRAVVSFRIVDTEVAAEAATQFRARHDPLTGLLNRAALLESVPKADGTRRNSDAIGILFCDLDRFKTVNDSFGHSVGDDLLRRVAATITSVVRNADVVARVGGDEIIVVLTNVTTVEEAAAIADKIRRAVAVPMEVSQGSLQASVSIGVTVSEPAVESFDAAVARADAAMYEAKTAGGNRVVSAPAQR